MENFSSYDSNNEISDFFNSEQDSYGKYMEYTRRPDAVKLFMMWKAKVQKKVYTMSMTDWYNMVLFGRSCVIICKCKIERA